MAIAHEKGMRFLPPVADHADGILFLDVREQDESRSETWPIPNGCQLKSIPLGELRSRVEELDKSKEIRIICRRGARSYQAALILKSAGFENVSIVGGGTQASLS